MDGTYGIGFMGIERKFKKTIIRTRKGEYI